MLSKDYVYTTIDKAYDEMAQLQLEIARKSRFSGEVNVFDEKYRQAISLNACVVALEGYDLNISTNENNIIELLTSKIKGITKDIQQWD